GVELVAGRIPVIIGTGSNDTRRAMDYAQQAERLGADGQLCVTPYYNKTTQSGLIRHYSAILDACALPMILYNVPSRTGCNILPQTYLELSKHPNIVAAKEANGNFSAIVETMALCGDNLTIYSGNDDQIIPLMSLGGMGVISVLSNILPRQTHNMCQKFFDGDVKGAAADQIKYTKLINALFSDVNPIPVKEAMNIMGLNVGPLRLPLSPMSDAARTKLTEILKEYGCI
ncbi:MAG: 4-hydroxy-tetrahydrodipicolinate synthase, partial [Clostridia bacterium]|nr:4-hydroxy-tetrahydrodipicolinate synthase [Clostridia bacterium]